MDSLHSIPFIASDAAGMYCSQTYSCLVLAWSLAWSQYHYIVFFSALILHMPVNITVIQLWVVFMSNYEGLY